MDLMHVMQKIGPESKKKCEIAIFNNDPNFGKKMFKKIYMTNASKQS